jgi:polar amino acid transport system substrate-binding protein
MTRSRHTAIGARRIIALTSAGGAALALSAAALGSAVPASASGAATARPAGAVPTPPKDPAVAALVPASLRKQGYITVAMDATYPPDEMTAANGTTIIGMDADMQYALSDVMGIKSKLINATFDTIIAGIDAGRYDEGNSSFTVTSAREKQVNFVTYFQAGEAFYVDSSSTLKLNGLKSLCGLSVSVESGTTEQSDAENTIKTCDAAHKKPDSVLTFDTQDEANLAVSSGRADLGFADSQVAAYIVHESHGQFKLDGAAIEVAPYGFAFPKGSTLDAATLAAVKVLMKDGIYTKILDKWGVQPGAISNPTINPNVG